MPDFASRNEASTSWVLLPIDETMPIPVTTTRLMFPRLRCTDAQRLGAEIRSAAARLQRAFLAEQTDLQVARTVDHRPIGGQPAVCHTQYELRAHHSLDIDAVDHL